MKDFDAQKTKDGLVKWIRGIFEERGRGCNAVIGISGGKDSSVVAALCAEALGRERVFGVLMPDGEQSDIGYAEALVEYLGIKSIKVNIHGAVSALENEIKPALDGAWSRQTAVNLPARIRMSTLYAVSQTVNGRVMNTCNLSEDWVGYSTKYGDAAGDFSPLAMLTSDEVMAIGEACGLPYEIVHKVPTDGLSGKTDEENLGFSYKTLNRYIRTGVCEDAAIKEKIDKLHRDNLFKLELMPKYEPEW